MNDERTPDEEVRGSSPFYAVVGFVVDQAGDGEARCSSAPNDWLDELTEAGAPAGALGFGDPALAFTASTVAGGRLPATISLQLDFLAEAATGPLRCTSRVTAQQDGVVLVEGHMEADGRPVARATLRVMLISARPVEGSAGDPAPSVADLEALPGDSIDPATGVLGGLLAKACGVRVLTGDEHSVTLSLTTPPELGRSHGVVHGGAVAAIGALAIAAVRERSLAEGARWRHLDARVDFLRELPQGRPLEVRATARHLGRRLALFEAEILGPDGRLAATTRETVVIQG